MASANPNRILLQNVRVRFSNGLFVASAPPGSNGAPAWSAKFILAPDHPQLPDVNRLIQQAAVSTFKAAANAVLQQALAAKKVCLLPGHMCTASDGQIYAGCEGNFVLSARNPNAAPVVLENKTPVTREQSSIYDGCYVNVQVDIFGYTKGSKGVGARLLAVQFAKDGEPLGGGGPASLGDFGEVESSAQAANEFGALFGGAPEQQATPAAQGGGVDFSSLLGV